MGQGQVKDWEKRWHTIFSSFDSVFRAFEEITASRYENFREFETKLTRVCFPGFLPLDDPKKEWEDLDQEMNDRSKLSNVMMAWFRQDSEKGELSLPVATLLSRFESCPPARDRNESGFFKKKPEVPGAVFQGGLPDNPVLTIYTRPLRAADFSDLFNLPDGKKNNIDDQTLNIGDKADGF